MKKELIDKLIKTVIAKKDSIPYINLDSSNKYLGWTYDFGLKTPNGEPMRLNLNEESDLFLLFVLASAWSKTGPWENAAYFVTYLKLSAKTDKEYWLLDANIEKEKASKEKNAKHVSETCLGIKARKKVSFRKDYFASIKVLASNWDKITQSLNDSENQNNFEEFIKVISELAGLGAAENKMRIKIPLILRELRCQNAYKNIAGKLCCVPDARVIQACKELGIDLPIVNSTESLFKASAIIYENFGDLYDIPLFAFEDLKEELGLTRSQTEENIEPKNPSDNVKPIENIKREENTSNNIDQPKKTLQDLIVKKGRKK